MSIASASGSRERGSSGRGAVTQHYRNSSLTLAANFSEETVTVKTNAFEKFVGKRQSLRTLLTLRLSQNHFTQQPNAGQGRLIRDTSHSVGLL